MHAPAPEQLPTNNQFASIFRDCDKVEFAGDYDTEKEARDVWKARAQQTVDNALMRFFIVPYDYEEMSPKEWWAKRVEFLSQNMDVPAIGRSRPEIMR
ncbi:hypothetical protein HOU00_gp475 [Caulobacter phage CcrPW]|uniref:Uncharacterized protein n=1 Tax=Caulobacter phage CcrPW TaxID=2283271 RepID=A0A385EAE4_9CAUD|nr:hypothetical protein HOU00_gp475 [Caulobacter phage CcrPW]AXQ68650.1 hypothetical protein CcrPW_gp111 [Caulobacter phage CcrPW]